MTDTELKIGQCKRATKTILPHSASVWASPYWTRHTVHSIRTENYLRMCLCSSVSVYATIAFNMMIKRLALFNIVRKSNIISIPCYYSATLHSICQWVVSPNRTQWFNLCSAQFSRDIRHLTLPIWIWIWIQINNMKIYDCIQNIRLEWNKISVKDISI